MRPVGQIGAAFAVLLSAAMAIVPSAPASATGSVRIQQREGSVKTYNGVTLKVANKKLKLTSADKVSTVVISGAKCAHRGVIIRCMGGGFSFAQEGRSTRSI